MKKLVSILALTLLSFNVAIAGSCTDEVIKAAKKFYEVDENARAYMNDRWTILYNDIKTELVMETTASEVVYDFYARPTHYDGWVFNEEKPLHYIISAEGTPAHCKVMSVKRAYRHY